MMRKLYNNQKSVCIRDDIPHEKSSPYTKIYNDTADLASTLLNGNTFKLWSYLCRHKHNYYFSLSSKDCQEKAGLAKSTYKEAVQKLIEESYLVLVDEEKGLYDFYPSRKIESSQSPEGKTSIIFDDLKKINEIKIDEDDEEETEEETENGKNEVLASNWWADAF